LLYGDSFHGDLGETTTTDRSITRLDVVELHSIGLVLLELGLCSSSLRLLSGGLLLFLLHDFVEINVLLFLSTFDLSPERSFSEFPPNFCLTFCFILGGLFGSEFNSKLFSDFPSLLIFFLLFGDLNLFLLVCAHLLDRDLNGLCRNRSELLVATFGLVSSSFRLNLNFFNNNGLFNDRSLFFKGLSLCSSLVGFLLLGFGKRGSSWLGLNLYDLSLDLSDGLIFTALILSLTFLSGISSHLEIIIGILLCQLSFVVLELIVRIGLGHRFLVNSGGFSVSHMEGVL
jgi:hypothetical protein